MKTHPSLSRDHDHADDHQLITILQEAKPYPSENDREALFMSAYRLARTIRAHEGTLDDHEVELDERWESAIYAWADDHDLDGEQLAEILYGLWPETAGPDKSAFHQALQAWAADPEVVRVGISSMANRAATFCYHLQQAVGRNGFFLGCRTLGAILGVSHTRAADILKALRARMIIRLVEEADFVRRMARQWVFSGLEAGGFTHQSINTTSQVHNHPLDSAPMTETDSVAQAPALKAVSSPASKGIEPAACFQEDGEKVLGNGGGGNASLQEEERDHARHDHEVHDHRPDHQPIAAPKPVREEAQPVYGKAEATRENGRRPLESTKPVGVASIIAEMASQAAPTEGPPQESADPLDGIPGHWPLPKKQRAVMLACKARGLDAKETRRHVARLMCQVMKVKETPLAITRVISVYDRVKSWAAVAKAAISLSGEATEAKRLAWLEYRSRAQAGIP